MDDFSTSVMIALLPTTSDWCKIKLPHLTLVFCGDTQDLTMTDCNEMAKTALDLALACKPLTLVVLAVAVFGDDDKVDVLQLRPDSQLLAMRSRVEGWNASEHPFNPHVTVGPMGSAGDNIPDSITFDRIAVGWGDTLLQFKMI